MKKLFFVFALLLFNTACLHATDVSLAWDQSVSPNIVSNKIYFGNAPGTYGMPITITAATAYTIAALGPGMYYFAVTAVDSQGNESDFSNEVSQLILSKPNSPTNVKVKIVPK